jgi:uncharacterized membrane-anchored protein
VGCFLVTQASVGWSGGLRMILHWAIFVVTAWALAVAFFAMGPGMATMVWLPTLRTISAALAAKGVVNERGMTFAAKSISAMLAG